MKIIDRSKLLVEMTRRNISIKDLSLELCVTYQCAYNKIKKNRDFTELEITALYRIFGEKIFSFAS